MKQTIYVNGDSFTSGVELADYLIPEWPGFLKKDTRHRELKKQIIKYENQRHIRFHQYVNVDSFNSLSTPLHFYDDPKPNTCLLYEILHTKERNHAWPNLLNLFSDKLNIINNSLAGAGIAGIAQRSILDLFKLRQSGSVPDIVIIQLTSTARQEMYDLNNDAFMYEMPMTENGFYFKNEHKNIAREIIKVYEKHHYLCKYLHTLGYLNESVKSITGKYPILIDSINLEFILRDIEELEEYLRGKDMNLRLEELQTLIQLSRIKLVDSTTMLKISQDVENPECPLGHLAQKVHDRFAKYIFKTYIKEKRVK